MATEKKKYIRKPKSNALVKSKGLFDHINHIREVQDPNYVDTLTAEDLKSWSNYMICRFLSMQPDIIEWINYIQVYQSILEPREFYRLCIAVVPRGRAFFPFVKGRGHGWDKELVELVRKHFQESTHNTLEYLELLSNDEIREIVERYGYTEKQIDKLMERDVKK